jgi:hypothetical protein
MVVGREGHKVVVDDRREHTVDEKAAEGGSLP